MFVCRILVIRLTRTVLDCQVCFYICLHLSVAFCILQHTRLPLGRGCASGFFSLTYHITVKLTVHSIGYSNAGSSSRSQLNCNSTARIHIFSIFYFLRCYAWTSRALAYYITSDACAFS